MADLSDKKSDFASMAVEFAADLIKLTLRANELVEFARSNGFRPTGANAIADADLIGGNKHLTASDVNKVVQAAQSLRTGITDPVLDDLRRAARKPSSIN